MIRIRIGKLTGGCIDTAIRCCGRFLANIGSLVLLVRDEIGDMDSSRLRTGCGQFVFISDAYSWALEASARL
jgi:hypothetical protein